MLRMYIKIIWNKNIKQIVRETWKKWNIKYRSNQIIITEKFKFLRINRKC